VTTILTKESNQISRSLNNKVRKPEWLIMLHYFLHVYCVCVCLSEGISTIITLPFPKLSSAYSYYGITGPKTSSATALPAHRAPPPLVQGHWKWCHMIDRTWLWTAIVSIYLSCTICELTLNIMTSEFRSEVTQVIETGTIRKLGYSTTVSFSPSIVTMPYFVSFLR